MVTRVEFDMCRRKKVKTSPKPTACRRSKIGANKLFKGIGNLANLGSLMKQAQEMGGKMQQMGEQLKLERVTGTAGAGLVEVEANGLGEVLAVRLDPSLMEKQDRELIEDLLPPAINGAKQKADELRAKKMQSVAGGMDMQGLDLSALGDVLGVPDVDKPAT